MTDLEQNISRLMAAKALGQPLSAEEERELEAWMNASLENKMLFERVASTRDAREIVKLERENYGEKMAARVMEKIGKQKSKSLRRVVYAWMGSAAAVIAVCVAMFSLLRSGDRIEAGREMTSKTEIVPGEVKAMLTFANGRTVTITDSIKKVDLSENMPTGIEEAYHTLSVPPGGEFFTSLPMARGCGLIPSPRSVSRQVLAGKGGRYF